MGKLRQKLDDALPGRRFIHTHFGFGYRFQAQPAENQLTRFPSPAGLYISFTCRRQVRNRLALSRLTGSPPTR